LDKIPGKFPGAQTIVATWDKDIGCRLDETWLLWQGGLVFLNPDGSIRKANPFDKYGEIGQLEKEGLAYFAHLERCPVFSSVTAKLFTASIFRAQGNYAGAVSMLEGVIEQARTYLPEFNRADRKAASMPDGYFIRKSLLRPEYEAYADLIRYYEEQNKREIAAKIVLELSSTYSNDGWIWRINDLLGDFFTRAGMIEKAEEQYQLAMKGLESLRADVEKRDKLVKGTDFPESFWKDSQREIKEKSLSLSKKGKK
jgi:tetratricopeptide (TPR) repeat protein